MTKISSPGLLGLLALAACAGESGLERTSAGYGYEFLHDAPGATVRPGEEAQFYLRVYNGDSLVQDSREQSPEPQRAVLPPADVDPEIGNNIVLQALQLMSEGDSLTIVDDRDSVAQRPPGFSPGDVLRLDVVLAEIRDSSELATERAAVEARMARVQDSVTAELALYKDSPNSDGYTTTATGLKYKVLEEGGGETVGPGQLVNVDYYGVLAADGTRFDDSYSRGQGIEFPLGMGAVIPGWDEGIGLLPVGSRAVLAIPSDLAYGENGSPPSIPPDSELLFYVRLNAAKGPAFEQ